MEMVEVERATDELRQDLKSPGRDPANARDGVGGGVEGEVGARRFERVGSRKGHRNGTYLRHLLRA